MIYVIAIGLALAAFGLYRRGREVGRTRTLFDSLASALIGWIAGLLIGVGARIGMAAIPFFNGAPHRFSVDGTIQVILLFSLFGAGLGLLYELFFRQLLGRRGWAFGLLVSACSWYSIAIAGLQQIEFDASFLSAALVSGAIVSVMFIPYSIVLEKLLERWHRFTAHRTHRSTSPVELVN